MIGRTNSGIGGGGLPPNSAVIRVTATPGSTITFSKGGVVVKALGPEKSHVRSDNNTLADWYYAVSSSNYGTWTVTATLDTLSTSNTITIDSNKQYHIVLAYTLWLFNGGAVSPYTFSKGSGNTFTVSSTIYIAAGVGGQTWGTAIPAVDLTTYSTLKMNVSAIGTDKDGRDKLYISTTRSASMAASVGATGTGVFSINVSSYSGDYYIGLFTNNNGNFTVNKIWLEGNQIGGL